MSTALRLERLQRLVKADLEALPDISPQLAISYDEEPIGGVPIPSEEVPSHSKATPAAAIDTHAPPLLDNSKNLTVPECDNCELESESDQALDAELERRFVRIPRPEPEANLERRFVLLKDVKSCWSADEEIAPSMSQHPDTCLERGALASPDQTFSPILPVSKYPYKFVNRRDSQRIASKFFDAGKFWMREWDL